MEGGKAAEIKERVAAERAASRVAAGLRLGARVLVDRDGTPGEGVVRYKGTTKFAMGIWLGIELDTDDGKHDGTVGTVRYFVCAPNRGIFVRPTQVTPIGDAISSGGSESTDSSLVTPVSAISSVSLATSSTETSSASAAVRERILQRKLEASKEKTISSLNNNNNNIIIVAPPSSEYELSSMTHQVPGTSETSLENVVAPLTSKLSIQEQRDRVAARRNEISEKIAEKKLLRNSEAANRSVSPERQSIENNNKMQASSLDNESIEVLRQDLRDQILATSMAKLEAGSAKQTIAALQKQLNEFSSDHSRDELRKCLQELSAVKAVLETERTALEDSMRSFDELNSNFKIIMGHKLALEDRVRQAEITITQLKNNISSLELKASPSCEHISASRISLTVSSSDVSNIEASLREELEDMQSMVENLSLDIEFEKEKSETLSIEVQSLQKELVRVKEEKETIASLDHADDSIERYQIELNKVKTTLRELAMSSEQERSKLLSKISSLENEVEELTELADRAMEVDELAAALEDKDAELQEMRKKLIDSNADTLVSMVEDLTEKNLELTALCEERQEVIDELEEMRLMSEELEEQLTVEIRSLRLQLNSAQIAIQSRTREMEEAKLVANDLAKTVEKFRDHSQRLQDELKIAQMSNTGSNERKCVRDEDVTRLNSDFNSRRARFAKTSNAVTSTLMQLEITQNRDRLNILKLSVPLNLISIDSASLDGFLLCRRLVAKCGMLRTALLDKIDWETAILRSDNIAAGTAAGALSVSVLLKLNVMLVSVTTALHCSAVVDEECAIEISYLRFGKIFISEVLPFESSIDDLLNWVLDIKGESAPSDILIQRVSALANRLEMILAAPPVLNGPVWRKLTKQCYFIAANCLKLDIYISRTASLLKSLSHIGMFMIELQSNVEILFIFSQSIQEECRKSCRLVYSVNYGDATTIECNFSVCESLLKDICVAFSVALDSFEASAAALPSRSLSLQSELGNKVDESFESSQKNMFMDFIHFIGNEKFESSLCGLLSKALESVRTAVHAVESGQFVSAFGIKYTVSDPLASLLISNDTPWCVRASSVCSDLSNWESIKTSLHDRDEESKYRLKALKKAEQAYNDTTAKLEKVEHRLKERTVISESLQTRVNELIQQEKTYQEAMETLQDDLIREQKEKKDLLDRLSGKFERHNMSPVLQPRSGSHHSLIESPKHISIERKDDEQLVDISELHALYGALEYMRERLYSVELAYARHNFSNFQLPSLLQKSYLNDKNSNEFRSEFSQYTALLKSVKHKMAASRVLDLTAINNNEYYLRKGVCHKNEFIKLLEMSKRLLQKDMSSMVIRTPLQTFVRDTKISHQFLCSTLTVPINSVSYNFLSCTRETIELDDIRRLHHSIL